MSIRITNIIDPGHFWAQSIANRNEDYLSEINDTLKNKKLIPTTKLIVGNLYAAPFEKQYHRARCEGVIPDRTGKNTVEVFFIDYGNKCEVPEDSLKLLPQKLQSIPAQALECVLCLIKPSLLLNSRGKWIDQAHRLFSKITFSETGPKNLIADIYSVTQGVIALELFENNQQVPSTFDHRGRIRFTGVQERKSINQILLDKNYAEPAEESYLSKVRTSTGNSVGK